MRVFQPTSKVKPCLPLQMNADGILPRDSLRNRIYVPIFFVLKEKKSLSLLHSRYWDGKLNSAPLVY